MYLKVALQNKEAYQMSISLLMVDIEKLSHTIIIFIKVMPYIQTSAQQKIRDKIVL